MHIRRRPQAPAAQAVHAVPGAGQPEEGIIIEYYGYYDYDYD